MKVVRSRKLSASGVCQNPQLASSLLKTVAPASCARVSSTVGKGCTSCKTLSFSGMKSTHMQTEPDFTTMPAHQGVGSSTLDMTPRDSICSSSSWTFLLGGSGTFLGVKSVNGLGSGFSLI